MSIASYSTRKKWRVSKKGIACGTVILMAIMSDYLVNVFGITGGFLYQLLFSGRYIGTLFLIVLSLKGSKIPKFEIKRFVKIFLPFLWLLFVVEVIAFFTSEVPRIYGFRYWTRALSNLLGILFMYALVLSVWKLRGKQTINTFLSALLLGQLIVFVSVLLCHGLTGIVGSVKSIIFFRAESTNYFEVHELTFCLGLFIIYFLFFSENKNKHWKKILLLIFLFVLGGKRIGFAGIIVAALFAFLVHRKGLSKRMITIVGSVGIIICFAFLAIVYSESFITLLNDRGINDMGRGLIYRYFTTRSHFDPSYLGWGVAGTSKVIENLDRAEVLYMQGVRGVHSSILDLYINYGFCGYLIWSIINLIYIPRKFFSFYGKRTATLYISLLIYAFITYLTDNTAGYFVFQVTLLLIPISEYLQEHHGIRNVQK